MKKQKVLLVGSSGRMGKEIRNILESEKSLSYSCGVSQDKSQDSKTSLKEVKPKDVDVVIDFSGPEMSVQVAEWCAKNKKPLVCGTTGFEDSQLKKVMSSGKQIPFLYSSNMSLGVAVLRRCLRSLSALEDLDFQIVEAHHNRKKDSPSGTAKTLQQDLESVVGRKLPPVLSIRGGGIFGIHQIHVMGEEETLELTHTALNRAVFARGAVLAAKFLLKSKPGLYSIDDVLDHQG